MKHRIGIIGLFVSGLAASGILWGAGYEFEGVGARAVSRGGAVVADSADWTAMYWNPGNTTRATKDHKSDIGFEIFGGQAYGKDSNSFSGTPLGASFSKQKLQSPYLLGAVGGALPVGEKAGLAFGIYTPLLQGSDFTDSSNPDVRPNYILDAHGSLGLITTTLSGGYQLTDQFSFGVGANFLYGRIKNNSALTTPGGVLATKLDGDGMGVEGVFGATYEAMSNLVFGTVYRTGSDVNLRGHASANDGESSDFVFELRHPATWALGTAWKPQDKLSLSFDINRTFWGRFSGELRYNQPGPLLTDRANSFDWNDTWKFRLGAAYRLSPANEIMGGYAYDRPALDKNSIDLSTTVDTNMNRLSFGWGHRVSEKTEMVMGALGGYGMRREGNLKYRLSGWQAMVEFHFSS